MNSFKIFIVEDDPIYGEMLKYHLSLNPDYEVFKFETGSACLRNLHQSPAIVSLDFSLPDMSGFEVISRIKEYNDEIPIIIVSGQEDISTAVELLKKGAYDYIVKNENTKDRLWNSILNIREKYELKEKIEELHEEIGKKYDFEKTIIGSSQAIKSIFKLIEKAINTNINVSITGETGTGKDLVAKAIHYNSSRSKQPFVPINVSAIPGELIESELFGYEKGAFTGAATRKKGKFEVAHNGTIFLDEIGEMDLNMQSKLLRVIQEKELTRVGGNASIKFDARLIVATNKNLAHEVQKGNFREDLYYRLLGLPIELPPLRQRGNDILILAKHFLDLFCKENGLKSKSIASDAKDKLLKYPFPGNVRELKAVMELSCVMSNDNKIEKENITFNSTDVRNNFLVEEDTLRGYTNKIIKYYLEKYNMNISLVAEKLDIGRSTIYRLIKDKEI